MVVKLASDGSLIFENYYDNGGDERFASITVTPDGGYITTGRTNSMGNGGYDVYLVKLTKSGEIEWERVFGGLIDDYGSSVKNTTDGGFIISGGTRSLGNSTSNNFENAYLIKTDRFGLVY